MEDKWKEQMREWIIIRASSLGTEGSDPEPDLLSCAFLSRKRRILVIFVLVVLLLIIN
jgi:hypothetical protein